MLIALTLLLVFQLAGEALSRVAGIAVPGPVIGFALLALLLVRSPLAMRARGADRGRAAPASLASFRAGGGRHHPAGAAAPGRVAGDRRGAPGLNDRGARGDGAHLPRRRAAHGARGVADGKRVPALGLSLGEPAALAGGDARRLCHRRPRLGSARAAPGRQSRGDRGGAPRAAPARDRHALPDLFRRRAIRPFHARPGHRRPGRAAGARAGSGAPAARADPRGRSWRARSPHR